MAMLVITRGYWLYQLWFFAYSRGSSQLASDAHLILAKLQCHPVTCQKLGFINISHTLFAHTVCLKLLKLENLLVCLLSLRAHTHMFASLLHERDTPFPHFPRWTIWAVWNWSHHVLMPDFPHFHHLQTPWDCGVNHSTLQSSKRIR